MAVRHTGQIESGAASTGEGDMAFRSRGWGPAAADRRPRSARVRDKAVEVRGDRPPADSPSRHGMRILTPSASRARRWSLPLC